jgi:uncharacterized protein
MDFGMMKISVRAHCLRTFQGAVLAAALLFSACNGTAPAVQGTGASTASTTFAAAETAPPTVQQPKGNPQPKLPTIKLWVGTNQISAEIASTVDQIRTGMMFRTNMAEMEGMLFVFPMPQQLAFYMRNTLLPLSCAYIDSEGTIVETYPMEPLNETPIPSKSNQIQYVLEMRQGWFERHNINPGMVLSTEHGPLSQTFRRR